MVGQRRQAERFCITLCHVIALFWPFRALAVDPWSRCGELLIGPTHVEGRTDPYASSHHDFQRSVKVLEWSYQTIFKQMKKPEFLAIVIDPKVDYRRFNAETWHVLRFPAAPNQEVAEDAVDAHEFAHAVFTENMNDYSPGWRTWQLRQKLYVRTQYPLLNQLDAISTDLWDKRSSLRDQLALFPAGNSEIESQIKAMTKEIRRVYDEVVNLPIITTPRPKIFDVSSAYQELISDLAGGLRMGNFAAYADYLEASIQPSLQKYDEETRRLISRLERERAFIYPVDPNILKAHLAKIPKSYHDHVLLNPARNFLLEKYLSNPKTLKNIDAFMAALFASTAKEVVEKAKLSTLPDYTMVESLNQELIQRWSQDLKDFASP